MPLTGVKASAAPTPLRGADPGGAVSLGRSVRMVVVRVGVVRVTMPERAVAVTMRVGLVGRRLPLVRMLVMGLVDVRVLVLQRGGARGRGRGVR